MKELGEESEHVRILTHKREQKTTDDRDISRNRARSRVCPHAVALWWVRSPCPCSLRTSQKMQGMKMKMKR